MTSHKAYISEWGEWTIRVSMQDMFVPVYACMIFPSGRP